MGVETSVRVTLAERNLKDFKLEGETNAGDTFNYICVLGMKHRTNWIVLCFQGGQQKIETGCS